tara:strand:+ start:494 stop:1525 length:1032 start_codon:yes stop_codon:yes gene_type:complete
MSAITLWSAGKLVDRLKLIHLAWWVCFAMAICATAFSQVQGPISLFFGILLVRFLGQGMMAHIATTAMARRYALERGRAIAIAGFGFPIAEGTLPPLITFGLTLTNWQSIWIFLGLAVAATTLPTMHFLLRSTIRQDGPGTAFRPPISSNQRHWTRAEMLRDKRFMMIAPQVMIMSAVFTGIIFHQTHIIGTIKEWDFLWWSFCFAAFAVCQVSSSFITGWLIDQTSARVVTPYVLAPFAVSLLLLGVVEAEFWAIAILATMGLSAGATNPSFSSLWAELYGTQHLGAIRSVGAVLMVFASALGPLAVGAALDSAIDLEIITWISVIMTAGTSILCWLGLKSA